MTQVQPGIQDLAPGAAMALEVDGQPVLVANVEGTLYAVDDRCPHRSCLLSTGPFEGRVATCPCHGSQFDVTTGAVVKGPARVPLATYPIESGPHGLEVHVPAGEQAMPDTPAAPAQPESAAATAGPAPPAVTSEEAAAVEQLLGNVPLFAGLDASALRPLQALTFRRTFAPGEVIVEEGHTGNGMYVVRAGRAECILGLGTPREQVVATYGPGDPFGELALLGDWKRSASVRAIDEVTCIGIDRWVFLAYLRQQPDIAIRMLQIVAERLITTNRQLA